MFSRLAIKQLLARYSLVKLYTDQLHPRYQPSLSPEENREFQEKNFGTRELPLYVILRPTQGGGFEYVDRFSEGLIRDVDRFAEFLRRPLAQKASDRIARRD